MDDKFVASRAYYDVGRSLKMNVDERRLSGMQNGDFHKEVSALSNEIIHEIEDMKKRYYEEGFKEALKQLQAQQMQKTEVQPLQAILPVAQVDTSAFEARMSSLEQKLSDRVISLEQSFLNFEAREGELKEVLSEHKDLVSTLKSRLSEIAVLQSSIEEKLSQAPGDVEGKIDSMKGEVENIANLVLETDSKINKFERTRKGSVRRLGRKLASLEKRLDDFKKVRKAIRKQGKRITTLQEVSVEKKVLKNALTRVKGKTVKGKKKSRRKAVKATVVRPKTLVIRSKSVKVVGQAAKKKSKASPKKSGKASKISISAQAPTTVEITQKK